MVDNSLINITAAATVCSDSLVLDVGVIVGDTVGSVVGPRDGELLGAVSKLVVMVDNVMTGCLVKVSTYGP
jgi:hypothetical protein